MCRIEERIYISADGHRSVFEDPYPCEKVRGGRLCSKIKRRTTEYNHKRGTTSRDDTPSPINPPTPKGTGTYLVQQRRPSGSGTRPPIRDGPKPIKPEIIIEFGSKKDKGKKYSSVSVSTKGYNRSSLGTAYIGSNDTAIESLGSDASYTIRTGFPEAPLPPSATFSQPNSYIATPNVTHGYHHGHTSSASSFTGSSHPPSLYVTSDDYDSPITQRTAKYPATIIHNPPTAAPSSPSRRQPGTSSYRTTFVAPQGFSQEQHAPDSLYPADYADFADRSASSHASSGAPEFTRRPKNTEERRKKRDKDHRRDEELERMAAAELVKAENFKQVRFELDRADSRAKERAEKAYAEKEKERAASRQEHHRRKEEERVEREKREKRERKEDLVKQRREEKSKPPTTEFNPVGTRRMSATMTPTQLAEQRLLLAAEGLHMQSEREAAEMREREERNAAFKQQQETPGYYDPRGGDRTLTNTISGMARRNSITRHSSVSSPVRPAGLTRTGSKRRTSIIQPNPPAINTQVPAENITTRPTSSRARAPPPLSFPAHFNQDYSRPPPSARRSSFTQDHPFAALPTRSLVPSLDNSFAPASAVISPTAASHDPWDLRVDQDAVPSILPSGDARYNTIQQRGAAVINRSATKGAQQATLRAMDRGVAGYADDYETDSDSPVDRTPVYASRIGLIGKGKKKY
ncbi:hypothetical protein EJ02DRAFT_230161 [Clathrospora elynae]|uniref:Uncharacterized protein n=1 Tax=Clathrospora elynae TaxID=706981 RepID=A0A6A5SLE0_9PLEO|nr:hypothetical protein EJ02DRAFT_230161 [Clathrospora elynae]